LLKWDVDGRKAYLGIALQGKHILRYHLLRVRPHITNITE
jgi:hypothetical protein